VQQLKLLVISEDDENDDDDDDGDIWSVRPDTIIYAESVIFSFVSSAG